MKVIWLCGLALSCIVTILAVLRGGYIGNDYDAHIDRLRNASRIFDFTVVDPPIYYGIGNSFFFVIGNNNVFPITLSIVQVLVNALALWWFFNYTRPIFRSERLHLGLVLLLTFLPVRMIHAASLGTDWMTIPVFVLLLYLFERFRTKDKPTFLDAALLCLGLALGVWSKYSFVALLPAFLLIFLFLWIRQGWGLQKFVLTCLLAFTLPSVLLLFSFWQGRETGSYGTHKTWIPKGGLPGQPEMDYSDLFSVKAADLELFEAPEMYQTKAPVPGQYYVGFRAPHKHSYLALSHMDIFSDPTNQFQILPQPQNIDAHLIPDLKIREEWKTQVMRIALWLGLTWTLLALAGTILLSLRAVVHLWRGEIAREDVLAVLCVFYFLMMFLPIPLVLYGALHGYWMPRLILAPLLVFFFAGFLLIDRSLPQRSGWITIALLALVGVQSMVNIIVLA